MLKRLGFDGTHASQYLLIEVGFPMYGPESGYALHTVAIPSD